MMKLGREELSILAGYKYHVYQPEKIVHIKYVENFGNGVSCETYNFDYEKEHITISDNISMDDKQRKSVGWYRVTRHLPSGLTTWNVICEPYIYCKKG